MKQKPFLKHTHDGYEELNIDSEFASYLCHILLLHHSNDILYTASLFLPSIP